MAKKKHVSPNDKILIARAWREKGLTAWKIARLIGRHINTIYKYRNYKLPKTKTTKTERTVLQPINKISEIIERDTEEKLLEDIYSFCKELKLFDRWGLDEDEFSIKNKISKKFDDRISNLRLKIDDIYHECKDRYLEL